MTDRPRPGLLTLSIAAVERDTGLSKDTLRVWERRYGFPTPGRDAMGERSYTLEQVERLRLIKRLLDAGHRPGRIVQLPSDEMQMLAAQTVEQPQRSRVPALDQTEVRAQLALVRQHDMGALRDALAQHLSRLGVARFIGEVVGPLNAALGDAWLRGQLEIFEEHLYTEVVQGVLRQAITQMPESAPTSRPRVLLSTFPHEPHGMGLLMAQAILKLEGCVCTSLGTQTPLWDTVLAARALRTDIVALSFSGCLNPNQVIDGLTELRAKLPGAVALWAGGSAPVLHRRRLEGVESFSAFDAVPAALQRWRDAHPAATSPRMASHDDEAMTPSLKWR